MYLTEKNIKNADLVSASLRCPFGETVADCPFIQFYKLSNPEEQIRLLNTLSEPGLEQLRSHHRSCIALRRSQIIIDQYTAQDTALP